MQIKANPVTDWNRQIAGLVPQLRCRQELASHGFSVTVKSE